MTANGTDHAREIKEVRDGKELHPRRTRGTGACYATPPSHCLQQYYHAYQTKLFSQYRCVNRHHIVVLGRRNVTNHRSLQPGTDRDDDREIRTDGGEDVGYDINLEVGVPKDEGMSVAEAVENAREARGTYLVDPTR